MNIIMMQIRNLPRRLLRSFRIARDNDESESKRMVDSNQTKWSLFVLNEIAVS